MMTMMIIIIPNQELLTQPWHDKGSGAGFSAR